MSNQKTGTIKTSQGEKIFGVLISDGMFFPYNSSEHWQVGDIVSFEIETREINNTQIEVAINLILATNSIIDITPEILIDIDFPEGIGHLKGHVSDIDPAIQSKNGYKKRELTLHSGTFSLQNFYILNSCIGTTDIRLKIISQKDVFFDVQDYLDGIPVITTIGNTNHHS